MLITHSIQRIISFTPCDPPGLDTIAGGSGTMWTTALQIGELVETAQTVCATAVAKSDISFISDCLFHWPQVYDPAETRILVTHASPGREGLLAQLALVLRVSLYRLCVPILTLSY